MLHSRHRVRLDRTLRVKRPYCARKGDLKLELLYAFPGRHPNVRSQASYISECARQRAAVFALRNADLAGVMRTTPGTAAEYRNIAGLFADR